MICDVGDEINGCDFVKCLKDKITVFEPLVLLVVTVGTVSMVEMYNILHIIYYTYQLLKYCDDNKFHKIALLFVLH